MTPREALWHVVERAPIALAVVGGVAFLCCLLGALLVLAEARVGRRGAGR